MLLWKHEYSLADYEKEDTEDPDPEDHETSEEVEIACALAKEVLAANGLTEESIRLRKGKAPHFDDDLPWYEPGNTTVAFPATLRDTFLELKTVVEDRRRERQEKEKRRLASAEGQPKPKKARKQKTAAREHTSRPKKR